MYRYSAERMDKATPGLSTLTRWNVMRQLARHFLRVAELKLKHPHRTGASVNQAKNIMSQDTLAIQSYKPYTLLIQHQLTT